MQTTGIASLSCIVEGSNTQFLVAGNEKKNRIQIKSCQTTGHKKSLTFLFRLFKRICNFGCQAGHVGQAYGYSGKRRSTVGVIGRAEL